MPRTVTVSTKSYLKTWQPLKLSRKVSLVAYGPGEALPPHLDSSEYISEKEQSLLSVVLYLGKAGGLFTWDKDFWGGQLSFQKLANRRGSQSEAVTISPDRGLVVVFPHITWHQSERLISGRKYCIRGDILCNLIQTQDPTVLQEGYSEHDWVRTPHVSLDY
eukprot:TRINITY_DN3406_c0_g1_i1.p1 TRINITY_DN3406_c0_g1~~TRINITY_DN3406_c0_g1_i1.p1  ORF type:complete len:162 (+),score=8.07 TRINITY_DN3406_c0_g1_i1:394-879(+)